MTDTAESLAPPLPERALLLLFAACPLLLGAALWAVLEALAAGGSSFITAGLLCVAAVLEALAAGGSSFITAGLLCVAVLD
ncbi:MAG: hypothetical protein ACXV5T_07205 [Halobacteriota archaeon]